MVKSSKNFNMLFFGVWSLELTVEVFFFKTGDRRQETGDRRQKFLLRIKLWRMVYSEQSTVNSSQ